MSSSSLSLETHAFGTSRSHRTATALRAVLILAGLLACTRPCAAQVATNDNSLDPGAWALQFRITENFTLGNFNGAGIGLKRHFSAGSALRMGVDFAFLNDNVEVSRDTLGTQQELDSQRFDIDLQYLWYPSPAAMINVFLGTGPFFEFAHTKDVRSDESEQRSAEIDAWATGVSGTFGAEWFATRRIALHAEYGLTVRYRSGESTSTPNVGSAQVVDSTSWRVGFDTVLFGISAYF